MDDCANSTIYFKFISPVPSTSDMPGRTLALETDARDITFFISDALFSTLGEVKPSQFQTKVIFVDSDQIYIKIICNSDLVEAIRSTLHQPFLFTAGMGGTTYQVVLSNLPAPTKKLHVKVDTGFNFCTFSTETTWSNDALRRFLTSRFSDAGLTVADLYQLGDKITQVKLPKRAVKFFVDGNFNPESLQLLLPHKLILPDERGSPIKLIWHKDFLKYWLLCGNCLKFKGFSQPFGGYCHCLSDSRTPDRTTVTRERKKRLRDDYMAKMQRHIKAMKMAESFTNINLDYAEDTGN